MLSLGLEFTSVCLRIVIDGAFTLESGVDFLALEDGSLLLQE